MALAEANIALNYMYRKRNVLFLFISWSFPWFYPAWSLEVIDKLKGIHRKVHKLSMVLEQLV